MAENTVSNLVAFDKGKALKFVEKNGEFLFTSEEIGKHLGYSDPIRSISNIFLRNEKELKHYAVVIRTMTTDGKSYETRAFTEEGVYILSMLARTNEAKKFRARVALLVRRLRESRTSAQINMARDAGYRIGFDEGRASALPDVLTAESTARAEGAKLALSLGLKERERLTKALAYQAKGLTQREIGILLGIHQRTVWHLLKLAERLGLAGVKHTVPALRKQGCLLDLQGNNLDVRLEVRHG